MPDLTLVEIHLKLQTENAGGIYRGIQPGVPEKGVEDLVLFDDAEQPKHIRSTMGLKRSEFSTRAVREAIAQQRVTYAAFAEKAMHNVLANFADRQAKKAAPAVQADASLLKVA